MTSNPSSRPVAAEETLAAAPFFVLRTPLLSADELVAWSAGSCAVGCWDDPIELPAALKRDRDLLRRRLHAIVDRPEVREALYVSSPGLVSFIPSWLANPDSKAGRKVERALTRYFSRMSRRPTPHGLCAGLSLGSVVGRTRLELGPRRGYERRSRISWEYLRAASEFWCADISLRKRLRVRSNTSAYRLGAEIIYMECAIIDGRRASQRVAVEASPLLEAVLSRAAAGIGQDELELALGDAFQLSPEDAQSLVGGVIDCGLLVPELHPKLTSREPAADMIDALRAADAPRLAEALELATASLRSLDRNGLGNDCAEYDAVALKLEAVSGGAKTTAFHHVDLFKPAPHATVSAEAMQSIAAAAELLVRIGTPRPADSLAEFRAKFVERYGRGAQVPLTEVLDEEHGIGFRGVMMGAQRRTGLVADMPIGEAGAPMFAVSSRDLALVEILARTVYNGRKELILTAHDLAALQSTASSRLPNALAVQATLLASAGEANERTDERIFIRYCTGPSGAELLGRFCFGSEALYERLRNFIAAEEALDPDAIHAEFLLLPDGSDALGNVVARPPLREFEITSACDSALPIDRQLWLSDLLVTIVDDEVQLVSSTLGKRIEPRMSCAFTAASASDVRYRFMCALAAQGSASYRWSWGAARAPFHPRVVYGRWILSPATWYLDEAQLAPLREGEEEARFRVVQLLRQELQLPRIVNLREGDQLLPVDFDNVLSVDAFLHVVKTGSALVLEETLGEPRDLSVFGPEGRFTHELIALFTKEATTEPRRLAERERPRPSIDETEWIEVSLYCGREQIDSILESTIGPLAIRLTQSGAIGRWCFDRVAQPDWHLRLLIQGAPGRLEHEAVPALVEAGRALRDQRAVWRIRIESHAAMPVSKSVGRARLDLEDQQLAWIDSECCIGLLGSGGAVTAGGLRWQLCLAVLHGLLSDFELALEDRITTARLFAAEAAGRLCWTDECDRRVAEKFRALRPLIDEALDAERWSNEEAAIVRILETRSARTRAVVPSENAEVKQARLLDAMHRHVNRMTRSDPDAHAAMLGRFLERWYESVRARGKGSASRQSRAYAAAADAGAEHAESEEPGPTATTRARHVGVGSRSESDEADRARSQRGDGRE